MKWLIAPLSLIAGLAWAGSATISWTPPTTYTNGEALTPAGYNLFERCGSDGYGAPIALPAVSSYTRTGLPDGTTCWWQLTALDAEGRESDRSSEAFKVFAPVGTVPGAPSSLVITWQGQEQEPPMAAEWIYAGGLTSTSFTSGNTSSGWQPQNFIYGGHITIPESGTVTKFGVYAGQDSVGPYGLKFGLYDDAGNLVAQSTGSVSSGPVVWNDSGAVSQAVPAGTYYLLMSAETSNVLYGFSASGNGSFATRTYAAFPADPETITEGGDTAQLYGVRLEFEATPAGGSRARSMLLGVN